MIAERERSLVRHCGRSTMRGVRRSLVLGFALGALALFASCGGREVCVQLERAASFEYPVYVATYYLTDPALLDDDDNKVLIDKFEEVKKRAGVAHSDLRPTYPGGTESTCQKDYDEGVTCVVLVANFKKSGACARYKTPIKPGQTLHIRASITEECLDVKVED